MASTTWPKNGGAPHGTKSREVAPGDTEHLEAE